MHKIDQKILSLGLATAGLIGLMYWQAGSPPAAPTHYTEQSQPEKTSMNPELAGQPPPYQTAAPSS
ncbi:MAG: hypothetical protein AAF541_19270 [Pseudomonadota bacterium]